MNFAIFLSEYSFRYLQHGAVFYHVSAIFYPFALVGVARAVIASPSSIPMPNTAMV